MAYTDRFYAQSEDDPFPTDPFRKFFGPTPTPTPKPKQAPVQLAMMGNPTGVLNSNAANRIPAPTPAPTGAFNFQPIGIQAGGAPIPPQMTHTEGAIDIARRNQAALEPVETPETTASTQTAPGNRPEYDAGGHYVGPNLAARGDFLRAATAYRPTLSTATLPGQAALDIVPTGTPLMTVKGIVDPFTGRTNYQPLNEPSRFQGPGRFQIEQAATDFYRNRNKEGYGTAY